MEENKPDERDNRPVRIVIDNEGVLIRAGDPKLKVCKETLKIIKRGGQVKIIIFSEFKKMKMYEVN